MYAKGGGETREHVEEHQVRKASLRCSYCWQLSDFTTLVVAPMGSFSGQRS